MYSKVIKTGIYNPKSVTWFLEHQGKPLLKSSNGGKSWQGVTYQNSYEALLCHDQQDMNRIQFETINK